MRIICELTDQNVLGLPGRSCAVPRRTARAILHDGSGRYAVMYASRFNLYTLPGGGVEEGEDSLSALNRELLEETGCTCCVETELGRITENRAHCDYTQTSDYYVARVDQTVGAPELTQDEAANGTCLMWLPMAEVWRRITEPVHDTNQRRFLQARDRAALEAYQHLMESVTEQQKTKNPADDL